MLHHGTLYASHVELTLILFHTLWGKCLQIYREFPCFDLPPLEDACVIITPIIPSWMDGLTLGYYVNKRFSSYLILTPSALEAEHVSTQLRFVMIIPKGNLFIRRYSSFRCESLLPAYCNCLASCWRFSRKNMNKRPTSPYSKIIILKCIYCWYTYIAIWDILLLLLLTFFLHFSSEWGGPAFYGHVRKKCYFYVFPYIYIVSLWSLSSTHRTKIDREMCKYLYKEGEWFRFYKSDRQICR